MVQPINQPTNQSINQPTNPPANQSINQSFESVGRMHRRRLSGCNGCECIQRKISVDASHPEEFGHKMHI